MRKTKVTEINGTEIVTETEGTFNLAQKPDEKDYQEGDVLEIRSDPQKVGGEVILNTRTGKEVRLPLPEIANQ